MVELKFLRYLYPIHKRMYVFYPLAPYLQWTIIFFIFIQYTFLVLYVKKPSEYLTGNPGHNFFHYILSLLFFLPWIFGTQSMNYDSIVIFVSNIVFVIFMLFISYSCYKNRYIPSCFIIWCRYYPQLLVPLFSFPLLFRISLIIEFISHDQNKTNITSLILYLLTFAIFFFTQYIASIFLYSCFFFSSSVLDLYDGKTHLIFYFIQMSFGISFMLLPIWRDFSYSGVFFILYIVFLLIIFFCRIFTTTHVSLIGQYFEISPLFAIPFMVLFHLYGPNHWFYALLVLFFLHIIFVIIINIIRKALKNAAFHVFDSFLYEDSTIARLPKFIFGNIVSYIRLIVYYNSDPAVLIRFLENQKQTHLRTSAFIEVCRFLSIFPEYRQLMLNEIKNFTSKSSYNRYTLYMFNFFLESSLSTTIPENYINRLDRLYFSYLSHSHFYWDARKNGKFFRAFFESFTTAFFHCECQKEIQGLFRILPYAPLLHKYYGDMLLNIDGKFDEYKKEIFFSIALEKRPDMFMDPLLHLSSLSNPKILQFCSQDYQTPVNHSDSSSSMSTVNVSWSENSHFLFSKSHKKENKSKKSSVASKIIRSKRHIPYLHYLNYIFPPLIVLVFIIYSTPMINQTVKKKNGITSLIDEVHRSFYSAFSLILAPFSLKNLPPEIPDDENECQNLLFLASLVFNQHYSQSPIISHFSNAGLIISFHDVNDFIMKSENICDVIMNLSSYMISNTISNIDFIIQQNDNYTHLIDDYRRHNQSMFKYVYFILYGSISVVLFLLIYFITSCITMNKIMSKNHNAIDFLSSDRRLAPIVQDPDSREIFWDQLSGFDSSVYLSESSFHMESESEIEQFSTSATIQTTSNCSPSASTFFQGASSIRQIKNMKIADTVNADVSESGTADKFELNRVSLLTLSHPTFSGSGVNVRRTQRTNNNGSHSARLIGEHDYNNNNNNESIITDSPVVDSNLNIETTNISSSTVNIDLQSNMLNLEGNINGPLRKKSSANLICQREIDFNSISDFLVKKKNETCFYGFHTIVVILLPWIILYFLAILSYYPLKTHKNFVLDMIDNANIVKNDFCASIFLVNETFTKLMYNSTNVSLYTRVNNFFESRDSLLSRRYFAEQCFQFETMECFSVSSIVQQLIEKNVTESFLSNYALPLFLAFSEEAMKELFYLRNDKEITDYLSTGPSFIGLVFLFSVIYIVNGYFVTKSFSKGLNSLFHYPSFESSNIRNSQNSINNIIDENINSKGDQNNDNSVKDEQNNINSKDEQNFNNNSNGGVDKNNDHVIINIDVPLTNDEKISRFPANVIIITSVTETDEIYSISDTCLQIINKKSSEMICRKLSRMFPIVKTSDGFDIRDHNGKTFISKSITIGKLSKTALIEASKVEAKNKTTNVFQKLINFMPNYFAKTFSEEFVNFFHFNKCVLIFVRIEPNAPQIENFFTIINRLDQTFFNIDFIRSNGSVLTLLYNGMDDLEILLFLRDLITSSEESCKRQMKNLALKSVYIDLIDELNVDILEGDIEPEIHFEEKQFLDSEIMTYLVAEHSIGISDNAIYLINNISKFTKQMKTLFEKTINIIPFSVFSDEIIKNM